MSSLSGKPKHAFAPRLLVTPLRPYCSQALPPAPSLPRCRSPRASGAPGGTDLAGIDRAVAPGDDFFRLRQRRLAQCHRDPADRSSYGAGQIVDERTLKRTAEVIKNAAERRRLGPKVSAYYAAYLDEARIESAGLKPLARANSRASMPSRIAARWRRRSAPTLRTDVDVLNNTNLHTENLFGLWIAQDLSDPKRYLPFLLQGGLVMPDRDYYLNPSQKMARDPHAVPGAHRARC